MEKKKPAPLELKILQGLWKRDNAATVQELCDAWTPPEEKPGYTTVLKKLQIMEEKGLISHTREGKAYRYLALASKGDIESQKIKELAEVVFEGDRLSLVLSFMKHSGVSAQELEKARSLLEEMKREGKND